MFKNLKLFLSVGLFLFGVNSVFANTITIFVHGKSNNNHCGTSTTDINSYWRGNTNAVSGTKYFGGYDGTTDPRTYGTCRAQTNLTTVLTQRCKGVDTSKIICYSAGCYATEYWLSNRGETASSKGFKISVVTALAAASAILSEKDDFAVAYHSFCRYSQAGELSICQSSVTQNEGILPFQSQKTYTQYSGHVRAPSVPALGLYENHFELCDDDWR